LAASAIHDMAIATMHVFLRRTHGVFVSAFGDLSCLETLRYAIMATTSAAPLSKTPPMTSDTNDIICAAEIMRLVLWNSKKAAESEGFRASWLKFIGSCEFPL